MEDVSGESGARAAVHVLVLGPFEVRRNGLPIELGGSQPRTVLAHLALDAGRVVSADRLIERLWGEEPPASALGTLQSYVSRLRRGLEPDREPGAPASVLTSEAPGYVLRIDRTQVDAFRFEAIAGTGRGRAAEGRYEDAIATYDEALALWRGPALSGLVGDDALLPTITRLEEARMLVVEDRFEAMLSLGRHRSVVGDLQETVAEHPLRERSWAQLALALYRSGRQADALRSITAARTTLGEELGLDPGPELRTLESQILGHDPELLVPVARDRRVTAPEPAEPEVPTEPPLIGRDKEWASVEVAIERAASGSLAFAMVEGEAGIGKSALVTAAADRCQALGWTVLTAQCVEEGLAPPLWPLIELLRGARSHTADDDEQARRSSDLLATIRSDDATVTAVEMASAIADALERIATARPLLVVVEDLHWADDATLEVLPLLLGRLSRSRVLMLTALRPADLGTPSPLSAALATLARVPSLIRLHLEGLEVGGVAELFAEVGGTEPTREQSEALLQRTGGNPLFVAELARLGSARLDVGEVPDAVRDVVRRRLSRLPPPTMDLLVPAAVLGQEIHLDVLAGVASLSQDRCIDDLDPALVTRILVPGGAGHFRFAHALVRDAVLADLSPLRLARLHQRAADTLEATFGDDSDHLEAVAIHRWNALAIDDPFRVSQALTRAAITSQHRASLERAKEMTERAMTALRKAPASERRTELEIDALEVFLSVTAPDARDLPDIDIDLDRVDAFAERNNSDIGRLLSIYRRWGSCREPWGDEAASLVQQALALADRSTEPYVVITTHYMAGSSAFIRGEIEAAVRHTMLAVDTERMVDQSAGRYRAAQVDIAGMAAFVFSVAGMSDEYIAEARRVGRSGSWMRHRHDANGTLLNEAFTSAVTDAIRSRPAEVARHVAACARDEFPVHTEPFWSACIVLGAWATAALGGTPDLDAAAEAMRRLDQGDVREFIPFFHAFLGDARRETGDLAGAEREFERSRAIAIETDEMWWLPEATRLLAATRRAQGAPGGEVRAQLQVAVDVATAQGSPVLAARAAHDLAAMA